jgi:glycerol-3-phosphate dehydrogenase (NAD(P)+)
MGAGSWGTAFASLCADAGEDVVLWARREPVAAQVNAEHRNSGYLGDIELAPNLRATTDPEEALTGAEVVVLAVPSHGLADSLAAWRELVPREAVAVSLVKGVETENRRRGSEVIRQVLDLPSERVSVVSGPNLAKECARGLPAATVAAGDDEAVTERVQAMSHGRHFRVYTNPDTVGVEVGGTVKNAIALCAGMAEGMGFGDNAKATVITRGLAEMTRLGVALGGQQLTFSGLAGIGDLVVTCTSPQSRNRTVGEELGRHRDVSDVVGEMQMVAEGVKSSKAIQRIAADHEVSMPIVDGVVKVCHEGMPPEQMAESLLGRPPKPEFHGIDQPQVGEAPSP